MKISDIAQKIENPALCSSDDVRAMEELIEKYPYAQSFPILLLKTLGQSKDVHFEDALNKYAFRISDRMHLYYLVNNKEEAIEETVLYPAETDAAIEEAEELIAITPERIENINLTIEKPAERQEEISLSDEEENVDQEDLVRLDYEKLLDEDVKFAKVEEMSFEPVRIHITETGDVTGVEDNPTIESQPKISEELETSTVKETNSTQDKILDIDLNKEEPIISENIDEVSLDFEIGEAEEIEAEVEMVTANSGIEFFDPTEELKESNSVKDISILEPSSFEEQKKTISLDLISKKFNPADDELTSNAISQGFHITLENENSNVNESTIVETIEQFEQNKSDEKRSFYSWLHANDKSINDPEKHDRSSEIIEKFIQEDPKISRSIKGEPSEIKKKVPFFKATEIAKESLMENVIPVSATLAQIFEAQGNFPKAIHTYEQLMLLYPEKKTFFANQIKNLKKKLNN